MVLKLPDKLLEIEDEHFSVQGSLVVYIIKESFVAAQ